MWLPSQATRWAPVTRKPDGVADPAGFRATSLSSKRRSETPVSTVVAVNRKPRKRKFVALLSVTPATTGRSPAAPANVIGDAGRRLVVRRGYVAARTNTDEPSGAAGAARVSEHHGVV